MLIIDSQKKSTGFIPQLENNSLPVQENAVTSSSTTEMTTSLAQGALATQQNAELMRPQPSSTPNITAFIQIHVLKLKKLITVQTELYATLSALQTSVDEVTKLLKDFKSDSVAKVQSLADAEELHAETLVEYEKAINGLAEVAVQIDKETKILTNFSLAVKIELARTSKKFEEKNCAQQLELLKKEKHLNQEQLKKYQELMKQKARIEELTVAIAALADFTEQASK